MRRITRNAVLVILAAVALLLALGALPSYLRSGDPYYVVATTAEAPNGTVNATQLQERRYRYTTGAIAAAVANGNGTGRSKPYWRGPFGFKESFTHSPFDEFDSLTAGNPNATATVGNETVVYLSLNGTSYRAVITQTPAAVGESDGGDDGTTASRLTPLVSGAVSRAEVAE